jgi:hypothetical protein
MGYLKGEDINVGIGREGTRGTYQAPTLWVPGRAPAGIQVEVEKTPIKETTGGGMSSTGAIVTQIRAGGDLEFNLRSQSIGYMLLSLLGKDTVSTVESGVYSHVFDILTGNPQFPTLSLGLSQLGQQDYKYLMAMVRQLVIRTPVNDLVNATATFLAKDEQTVSDYTPSFSSNDVYFRPQDIVIKVASDVSGLSGATALKLKELSVTINNNARVNQNISELNPGDVLAVVHEVTGSFTIDYQDESAHDIFKAGTSQAMSIEFTRSDLTIGAVSHPKLTLTFPAVTYEKRDQDRKLDDIVMDKVDFTAHFDTTAGYGVRATLVNEKANYTT